MQKGYKKKQETRFQTTAEIKQPNLKQTKYIEKLRGQIEGKKIELNAPDMAILGKDHPENARIVKEIAALEKKLKDAEGRVPVIPQDPILGGSPYDVPEFNYTDVTQTGGEITTKSYS